MRDNWMKREKRVNFLAYINVWIWKVLLLMCGCGCAALHPPPLLLLLANHRTTLLYLGHSNVLLLSPLADALCCNLRKIGWEEEKSAKSERREGVVTEARSFLHSKNWTLSFVISFQYVICLRLQPFPLSLFMSSKDFLRPAAAAWAKHPPSTPVPPSLLFMSGFTLCQNHRWSLLKTPATYSKVDRKISGV